MRLIAPRLESAAQELQSDCARRYGRAVTDVRVIEAPYRLCPLGAHIDHQLGPVSAIAVAHGIQLAFVANDEKRVEITSSGYPGAVSFSIDQPQARARDWADYARGAAKALGENHVLNKGVSLLIQGHLSEAGISSSAAVGLGYLLAMATVNDLTLAAHELIELDRVIENEFLGLKNGVLDPSAIALAQAGKLAIIDCASGTSRHLAQEQPFVFLAVFSGLQEALVNSGKFNDRVEQCLQAGALLANRVHGTNLASCPLGKVSRADWLRHQSSLQGIHRKRATHFFTESQRVVEGADAWAASDPTRFGRLMTESGLSSIANYETGSPEMIRLFEDLNACSGVWGARFSGAGFRGCAVALVEKDRVPDIVAEVEERYLQACPQFRNLLWAFETSACQGLRLL